MDDIRRKFWTWGQGGGAAGCRNCSNIENTHGRTASNIGTLRFSFAGNARSSSATSRNSAASRSILRSRTLKEAWHSSADTKCKASPEEENADCRNSWRICFSYRCTCGRSHLRDDPAHRAGSRERSTLGAGPICLRDIQSPCRSLSPGNPEREGSVRSPDRPRHRTGRQQLLPDVSPVCPARSAHCLPSCR